MIPETTTVRVLHGFRTDGKDRQISLYGEELHIMDEVIILVQPFEQPLLNEQDEPLTVLRDKNPGAAAFEQALTRAHRRLAPTPKSILT